MENNTSIEKIKEDKSKKRPKNYPFCDNADVVVNNDIASDTPHFETINIYKYCWCLIGIYKYWSKII